MDGHEKKELYAKYKNSLKFALKHEFWLQAIFIEYAIFEDRAESTIRHAGNIKLINKQGHDLKLSEKLNKIKSCAAFTDKKIRKYLSVELLDEIYQWKKDRDVIIHSLMKLGMDDDFVKDVAIKGNDLVRKFDNKVKSANNAFNKRL